MKFVSGRVENIVGKGENAGYQHFLLFLQCFQKTSYTELLKVMTVWQRCKELKTLHNPSLNKVWQYSLYIT